MRPRVSWAAGKGEAWVAIPLGAGQAVLEGRPLHRSHGVVDRSAWALVVSVGVVGAVGMVVAVIAVGAVVAHVSIHTLGLLLATASIGKLAILLNSASHSPLRVAVVGSPTFCGRAAAEARNRGRAVVATMCRPNVVSREGDLARLDELVVEISSIGLVSAVSPSLCDGASRVLVVDPAASDNRDLFAPVLSLAARTVKRTIDILVASVALLLVIPACAAVAIAIRADSRGPVFFTQSRVGIDGRRFRLYKFRTMFPDNDDSVHRAYVESLMHGDAAKSGPMFKLANDPRITGVGRVLRRYSFDEVPQLLNVLKGDMSIVGPRPPLPSEVASYDGRAWQRLRVRPGVTGLWQVRGRSLLDFHQMVDLDVEYWETWTLGRELSILARTPGAVLSCRGAA